MSVKVIDHIVDEHHIEIDSEMIKKAKVSWLSKPSISTVFLLSTWAFFCWLFQYYYNIE